MSSSPLTADLFDRDRIPPRPQPRSLTTTSDRAMRKSGQNGGTLARSHAQTCADRVAGFLRARHPVKTTVNVQAETGYPADTVRGWLNGHAPSGEAMLDLVTIYKSAFLAAVRPEQKDAWFVDLERELRQRELEARLAETQSQLDALWSRR